MTSESEELLVELRKIRELLEPKPAPPPTPEPKGLRQEFIAFLAQYKVLGLAVAFILGIYLGALVKALVSDLILPILQVFLPPNQSINSYVVGPFGVGDFANALLTFLIVAFVIFLIVKLARRYKLE
jgi:large conductance mechanosensitive channel